MTKSKFNKMLDEIRSSEAYGAYSKVVKIDRSLNVDNLKEIPLVGVKRIKAPWNEEGIEQLTDFYSIGNGLINLVRVSVADADKLSYVGNIVALYANSSDRPYRGRDCFFGDVFMGFDKLFGRNSDEIMLPSHFALTSVIIRDQIAYCGPSFTNVRKDIDYDFDGIGKICFINLFGGEQL